MTDEPSTRPGSGPPDTSDYLPAAIQKAVVRTGLAHPVTIYAIALGVSVGVVGSLFDIPVLLGAAVGLTLLGPAWAVLQIFFRHEAIGSRYLESLHHRQKQYERRLIGRIEDGLRSCITVDGLERAANTGIAQLKNIQIKLDNVKALLGQKLRPGEITHGRFLGAAEQVSLSVLDNLNTVASVLKSAASIDLAYIHERLRDLDEKSQPGQEDADPRPSLQARLDLWNRQIETIDRLMAGNEAAMTEMERISAAVARWPQDRKFADSDIESAIAQLHALASQAHDYETLDPTQRRY
ncbi:hypothetical protein [Desulfosarcina ovata]|uniref:Uncharacterized protein n=1 Tax=Desulfosarcina ovata subsp. ovata TaxID=2752305 RepID=A0A5K8AIA6_9BACT|nr:hypothetical protein [Desulfosarcina ovata]BBO92206.1 hypothetical protein DSCOOX_53860 [Desulfosarcina ovata subsp. ovata]